MRLSFAVTVAIVPLLLGSIAACAQVPPPASGAARQQCSLPAEPNAVAELARKGVATIGADPSWGGAAAGLIAAGQPITLHLTFPSDLAGAPDFAVAARLGDGPAATWQRLAVEAWQQAKTDPRGGDLTLAAIPDDQPTLGKLRLDLVVAACAGGTLRFGQASGLMSLRLPSVVLALAITFLLYALAAVSIGNPFAARWRRLNPLWLAIDGSGRASLSQMQVIFFSVIVLYLVTYILLRTGILASLSDNVLLLLGIAGVGSVGGQLATNQTQRVSFDNWAWMQRKGWTTDGGNHVEKPRWTDLFSTNDVFDPYRFQMVSFSCVIGVSLLMLGLSGLANFTVPQSLLVVIGLSQGTYLAGKITAPATFASLDARLTELRKAQDAFLAASAASWLPPAAPGTPARAAQRTAAEAAHSAEFAAFQSQIGPAYEMFRALFKFRGANPSFDPDAA